MPNETKPELPPNLEWENDSARVAVVMFSGSPAMEFFDPISGGFFDRITDQHIVIPKIVCAWRDEVERLERWTENWDRVYCRYCVYTVDDFKPKRLRAQRRWRMAGNKASAARAQLAGWDKRRRAKGVR